MAWHTSRVINLFQGMTAVRAQPDNKAQLVLLSRSTYLPLDVSKGAHAAGLGRWEMSTELLLLGPRRGTCDPTVPTSAAGPEVHHCPCTHPLCNVGTVFLLQP